MKSRGLIFAIAVVLVASGVGVTLFATGMVGGGRSVPSVLSGGSPYPMAQLLAFRDPVPLHGNVEASVKRADAQLSGVPSEAATLDASGVSVAIDGQTVANGMIAMSQQACQQDAIVLAAQNAVVAGLDPASAINEVMSSPYCEDQAVALQVLRTAAITAATAAGTAATAAQTQAFAQQQYAAAQAAVGTSNAITVPAGQSLENMFFCASCIAGYQDDLTYQTELAALTARSGNGAERHAMIASWLSQRVAANGAGAVFTGVPDVTPVNLASYLPSQLGLNPITNP